VHRLTQQAAIANTWCIMHQHNMLLHEVSMEMPGDLKPQLKVKLNFGKEVQVRVNQLQLQPVYRL
jgi:hypothetical protein